ncbi:MAG TPA: hypothetical protein VFP35_03100 [Candidatus Saccharimonadales bacterium]|nr:hypothetical protein [Candidatus Saccharimonadales bacterium]
MEKGPDRGYKDVAKVGRMVCRFIENYHTFIYDEAGNERAVIFRYEDLDELPFDESGNLEVEDVVAALPKAILPSLN